MLTKAGGFGVVVSSVVHRLGGRNPAASALPKSSSSSLLLLLRRNGRGRIGGMASKRRTWWCDQQERAFTRFPSFPRQDVPAPSPLNVGEKLTETDDGIENMEDDGGDGDGDEGDGDGDGQNEGGEGDGDGDGDGDGKNEGGGGGGGGLEGNDEGGEGDGKTEGAGGVEGEITETRPNRIFAILVDSDTTHPKILPRVHETVSKLGKHADRKSQLIYGQFHRTKSKRKWQYAVKECPSFRVYPVGITGMVNFAIEKMVREVILKRKKHINGIALVTSDPAFGALAKEIRERKRFVIGFGHRRCSRDFADCFDQFEYYDPEEDGNLKLDTAEDGSLIISRIKPQLEHRHKQKVLHHIQKMLKTEKFANDEGWVPMGPILREMQISGREFRRRYQFVPGPFAKFMPLSGDPFEVKWDPDWNHYRIRCKRPKPKRKRK